MAATLGEHVEHLVDKAITLATRAHTGQVDKLGDLYIMHPLRVMIAMPKDETLRAAAVMHDVLEDSGKNGPSITATQLLAEEWPRDLITALLALTHIDGEPYPEYVRRAAGNPIARVVKRADIDDNLGRVHLLVPAVRDRLTAKYEGALPLLE